MFCCVKITGATSVSDVAPAFTFPLWYPRRLLFFNQHRFRLWIKAERQPSIGCAALSLCSSVQTLPNIPGVNAKKVPYLVHHIKPIGK